MKKKYQLLTGLLLTLILISSAFLFFTTKKSSDSLFGTYHIYSTDPVIQRHIQGQKTFLKINENNTIAYNTTINGKRKYDFSGTYILDGKTNTLTIAWLSGKLPKQLKIEKEEEDYIIRIGETIYKKEKNKS